MEADFIPRSEIILLSLIPSYLIGSDNISSHPPRISILVDCVRYLTRQADNKKKGRNTERQHGHHLVYKICNILRISQRDTI